MNSLFMKNITGGHTETVKLLLKKGADVNQRDDNGETPLNEASISGHGDIVILLLANGADVNAKNNYGDTALIWASFIGNINIVRLLLANGADVNAKKNNGQTSLMMVSNYDEEFINYFISLQGIQQVRMMKNKKIIINLLQRYGADFNLKDDNNNTAYDLANQCNDDWTIADDIIKLLKQYIVVQSIQKHKERQKNQTKLGWMLRGIKVKNRSGRLPDELEYYIRRFIG